MVTAAILSDLKYIQQYFFHRSDIFALNKQNSKFSARYPCCSKEIVYA